MLDAGEIVMSLPFDSVRAGGARGGVEKMEGVSEESGVAAGAEAEEGDETFEEGDSEDLDDTYISDIKDRWERERKAWQKEKQAFIEQDAKVRLTLLRYMLSLLRVCIQPLYPQYF